MDIQRATSIIGSQPDTCVRNMVRALGMHSWGNTPEENERREAGQYVLRHKKAWHAELQLRRDAKGK